MHVVRLLAAVAAASIGAALSAQSALAFDRPPLIEQVASVFALRTVDVRCPTMQEWVSDPIWGNDPNPERAWGYTDIVDDFSVVDPMLCAGALGVTDLTLPSWQRATGVLVLVHESFHLRHWPGRYSEAKVECQAIRHFLQGAQLLGASPALANNLLPNALAAHNWMVREYPNYFNPKCKLPVWKPEFSP